MSKYCPKCRTLLEYIPWGSGEFRVVCPISKNGNCNLEPYYVKYENGTEVPIYLNMEMKVKF